MGIYNVYTLCRLLIAASNPMCDGACTMYAMCT